MIKITFPDGNVKEFEKGTTAYQIASGISPRLANDVLCASVNDQVYDLERPILEDATLKLHKWEDREAKNVFWHSSSHLMAEALEALYPGIKLASVRPLKTVSIMTWTWATGSSWKLT